MSSLLQVSSLRKYHLYRKETDMRKGFDSLCGIITKELNRPVMSGDAFIFINRQRTHLKLLAWESGGFSVVFTLPGQLNTLALQQPAIIYDALFKAVWLTLNQFGNNAAVQLGMIAVLHTWGQNLSLHPHLHCIVPGGGISKNGQWQKQLRSNKYLFSVKALSKVFRAKYVQQLRANGIDDKTLIETLFQTPWVVYAKRPFGGPSPSR